MVKVVGDAVALTPAPIPASWVTGGTPMARNAVLAVSADRTALTLLWDCSAGSFRWIYEQDETIHILEGAVTLTLQSGRVEQLGPGSIVFFPAGSVVDWTVHGYVRKLAVFRETVPSPVALFVRLRAKARQMRRERTRPSPRSGALSGALPQPA